MKLRYVGLPNHTMLELVVAGVIQAGEPLEVGKVYDIPSDDDELNRKLKVLIEAKEWESVNVNNKSKGGKE